MSTIVCRYSSVGRASVSKTESRGFKSFCLCQYVRMPERFKGPVCKTGVRRFESDFSLKDLSLKDFLLRNGGFRKIQIGFIGSLLY